MNLRGNAGAEVTADRCCADQQDFGFELLYDRLNSIGVGFCSVILEFGIIYNDDLIRAIRAEFIYKVITKAGAKQNGRYFLIVKIICKISRLAQKLQRDGAEFVIHLLGKDIYSLILF